MQMNDFHWLVSASAPMSGWLAEDGICMTSEKNAQFVSQSFSSGTSEQKGNELIHRRRLFFLLPRAKDELSLSRASAGFWLGGSMLPCLATFNVRSLRNKVDLFTTHGIDILCLTETWHGRWRCSNHIRALQSIDSFKAALKTYLFDCSWPNPAETVWQSSTVWLTRALVTSLSCYGALEIVGRLLLLLLLLPEAKKIVEIWLQNGAFWSISE